VEFIRLKWHKIQIYRRKHIPTQIRFQADIMQWLAYVPIRRLWYSSSLQANYTRWEKWSTRPDGTQVA